MAWPMRHDNWRKEAIPAQKKFAQVAWNISQFETLCLCLPNEAEKQKAISYISDLGPSKFGVKYFIMDYDDAWMRDTGPIFVVSKSNSKPEENGKVIGTDWKFNSWGGLDGGLYHPWDNDDAVAAKVCDDFLKGMKRIRIDMVLEGGSISSDGEGTLLTTEECLLNPNRNPTMTKEQIENQLKKNLGVSVIVWIPRGCYGDDDTNGHVDNLVTFLRPGAVVLLWCDDDKDAMYEICREAERVILSTKDAKGRTISIHKIHQPRVSYISEEEAQGVRPLKGTKPREAGTRMAASYANCLLVNNAVIMPVFEWDDEANQAAIRAMSDAFEGKRQIIPIPSREILLGGGNIHCITCHQVKQKY